MKQNGRATVTFQVDRLEVTVPDWVSDLESFRRWADSDDFTEKDRVSWIAGKVLVDMSKEQIFTHVLVKTRVGTSLDSLSVAEGLGIYLSDGAFLTNEVADLSVKPDGVFLSNASLDTKRVWFVEGVLEGHVEIEGSPDMVLEVLSTSSVKKDTVQLREGYWKAGIPEYWLIDARQEPPTFDILRTTDHGYVETKKQKGWVRSQVFGKSFRLTRTVDAGDRPTFRLEVR